MIRKLSISAMALAAVGMAAPAMAQETVDLDITVQSIAELVTETATGSMIIDDTSDTLMGNPSSSGSVTCGASNLSAVRLNTNYPVGHVQVTFPRTRNIRRQADPNWPNATWNNVTLGGWVMEDFARAIGDNDSQILGVYPFSAIASGSGCDIIWHNDPLHSEGPTGGGTNGFRVSSGGSSGVAGSPFTNGTHLIELGVSGNWSNTLIGEPVFAAPQTYEVTLTATLVP